MFYELLARFRKDPTRRMLVLVLMLTDLSYEADGQRFHSGARCAGAP
jgi:hypothetical protein